MSGVTIPLSYKSKLICQHISIRSYTSNTASQVTKMVQKVLFTTALLYLIVSWPSQNFDIIQKRYQTCGTFGCSIKNLYLPGQLRNCLLISPLQCMSIKMSCMLNFTFFHTLHLQLCLFYKSVLFVCTPEGLQIAN